MSRTTQYHEINLARQAYLEGKNVTEVLREQVGSNQNTSDIIELSYDLQSGSYIDFAEKNSDYCRSYAAEMAGILDQFTEGDFTLLDAGTGEITTCSLMLSASSKCPKALYAFDISWSRLWKGGSFAKKHMPEKIINRNFFVADMTQIPLRNKSVDYTVSNHSLEPNGGREKELLKELFRVTTKKLMLFEPCYEINSPEGKKRMEKLGYISNLDEAILACGGTLEHKIILKNISNPLNPTVCFVINPNSVNVGMINDDNIYSVPGTDIPLNAVENGYFSPNTGLYYPSIKSIPILKNNSSVIATAFAKD